MSLEKKKNNLIETALGEFNNTRESKSINYSFRNVADTLVQRVIYQAKIEALEGVEEEIKEMFESEGFDEPFIEHLILDLISNKK